MLKEMLREEKLRSSKLATLLQKERLKQEVVGSPTFQIQRIRQELESEYVQVVESLETENRSLREKLFQ